MSETSEIDREFEETKSEIKHCGVSIIEVRADGRTIFWVTRPIVIDNQGEKSFEGNSPGSRSADLDKLDVLLRRYFLLKQVGIKFRGVANYKNDPNFRNSTLSSGGIDRHDDKKYVDMTDDLSFALKYSFLPSEVTRSVKPIRVAQDKVVIIYDSASIKKANLKEGSVEGAGHKYEYITDRKDALIGLVVFKGSGAQQLY